MIIPKERLAILSRIRAVGRQCKEFRASTCIGNYFGHHYASDWNECLSSMVKKGQLSCDGKGNYSLK